MHRITKVFITNSFRLSVLARCKTISTKSEDTTSENGFVVNVKSTSLIKPFSPTPVNLKNFNLSIFDQFIPHSPIYPSFVFFYPPISHTINNTTSWLLRDSFSKTLSHFYPFAGRLKEITINCNDQGAEYLEAEANQEMSQFLGSSRPNTQMLSRLSPPRPSQLSVDIPLACVQTTVFRCGGIAIGVSLNHIIADGYTCSILINHWAAISRGAVSTNDMHVYAHDMAASLFPINDAVLKSMPLAWRKVEELSNSVEMPITISKRFVFKEKEISALKSIVKSSEVPNPSRTLAIFGLIWKAAMEAYILSIGQSKIMMSCSVLSAVNLRPRFKTLLPNYSIGNLVWNTEVERKSSESYKNYELKRLTHELKRSVEKVDTEFVENLKGEKGHKELCGYLEARGLGTKAYFFSSMLSCDLNKADFGRGKPIWVSFLGASDVPFPDFAVLVEATPNDGTIEAWVNLTKKEMDIFQRDPQLLQYATINPRIL
ncbi:BAHD acyltransferase At5g47980 [Linum grandiflorum]